MIETADKVAFVKKLVEENMSKNKIMTIEFIKKTTGELRKMMIHRSKKLENSTLAANGINLPSVAKRKSTCKARNILNVEELVGGVHQWRSIPADNVTKLTCDGRSWDL